MARTRIHHEEKKNEIIGIALSQFMLRGYEETTISHIMKAADISKGALYHYFSSKDEILNSVMEFLMEHEVARLRSLISDPAMSGCDKFARLLMAGEPKPEELQQVLENYRKIRNSVFHYRLQEESMFSNAGIFAEVIAEGVASGDFCISCPPIVLAELFAGTLKAVLTAAEMETGDHSDLQSRIDQFICLLEWGLGVENESFPGVADSLYRQILPFRGCRYQNPS